MNSQPGTIEAAAAVETYRGIVIQRTVDVLGFHVRADDAFCFTTHYRRDDDAPFLEMARTVEQCRMAIDDFLDDGEPLKPEPEAAPRTDAEQLIGDRIRHEDPTGYQHRFVMGVR